MPEEAVPVPVEESTEVCNTMFMYDSFGDSWNGNVFEIGGQTGTVADGSYVEQEVCLPAGCYNLSVGGGSW